MGILKKKPKGPTYTSEGNETTVPFPTKKVDGYYTSMKGVYEDGMDKAQELKQGDSFEFNNVLKDVMVSEGGTPEQYKKHLNHVAYHESAGTMKPDMKQFNNGPGRGVYQYEPPSARTAVNRAKLYYEQNKRPLPKFIDELDKQEKIDFSTLSREKQDTMYLLDKYMGEADFSELMSGKVSEAEWWGKNHQTTNDPIKNKKFAADAIRHDAVYSKSNMIKPEVIQQKVFRKGGILLHKDGGQTKNPIIYTDKDKFDKAKKMHDDSLNTSNIAERFKVINYGLQVSKGDKTLIAQGNKLKKEALQNKGENILPDYQNKLNYGGWGRDMHDNYPTPYPVIYSKPVEKEVKVIRKPVSDTTSKPVALTPIKKSIILKELKQIDFSNPDYKIIKYLNKDRTEDESKREYFDKDNKLISKIVY